MVNVGQSNFSNNNISQKKHYQKQEEKQLEKQVEKKEVVNSKSIDSFKYSTSGEPPEGKAEQKKDVKPVINLKKARSVKEGTLSDNGNEIIREEVNVGATEGFEPHLWSQETFFDFEMKSISFMHTDEEGGGYPVTIPIDYMKDLKALDLTDTERKMLRENAINLRSIEDKNGNISFQVDFLFGGARYIVSNQREGPTNPYFPQYSLQNGETYLEIKTGDVNNDGKVELGETSVYPERF